MSVGMLPARVMSWYGDDFTGSTDVLEALAPHMPAVLFLEQPDAAAFAPFAEYAAFGLAGSSRSETRAWMDAHLPGALGWLRGLGAAVCHYKVCSTFDSSPAVGSIGRALEIGREVFGAPLVPLFVPMVVGAPSLRRYTFHGELFAGAADGAVYRVDRHPAMMRHPVTPMDEADLRRHLARQTSLTVGLVSSLAMGDEASAEAAYRVAAGGHAAVLIDVHDAATLAMAGRLLWDVERQPFVVGSSGVAYALLAHWGLRAGAPVAPAPVDRLVVLSGSCSPATARQIAYAEQQGFALVALDVSGGAGDDAAVAAAVRVLAEGRRGVVIYSSRSAEDRVAGLAPDDRRALGERSGRLLRRVLEQSGVSRAVIAGGDTSSHAGRQLGIVALTFVAHLAPGAPLCRAWFAREAQPLEVVFKGGQCGQDNFFATVLGDKQP